jgi:excisionase family DNA binding protein
MWSLEDEELPEAEATAPTSGALLLRMEDAAARLGIARTSMFKLVRTGEVESVRVGRLRRVPVASLDEYVARLRRQCPDGPSAA